MNDTWSTTEADAALAASWEVEPDPFAEAELDDEERADVARKRGKRTW